MGDRQRGQIGTPPLTLVDAETVARLLPMPVCIELMADVQAAISRGEIALPLRSFLPVAERRGSLALMPGELSSRSVFGAKLLSLFPGNRKLGKPTIQGQIVLFDGENGTPLAVVDAASVTAIRTAAASGAATRALAREDAHTLALLGYGVQAATHLEAMLAVRPIDQVRVWGPSPVKAADFAAREADRRGVPIAAVQSASAAVSGADLICTVSGAREPILESEWLQPGAHINLVGAHGEKSREADGRVLGESRVFTEITEFALAESGDLLLAIEEGALRRDDVAGEIGEVLDGRVPGRRSAEEITLYVSLGNTAQDLAAARYVVDRAGE